MSTSRGFYLLEKSEEEILGSRLPSRGQVLGVFLHHHISLKKQLRESAEAVWSEVEKFWSKARIPTQRSDYGITRIISLHDEWRRLKKNRNKKM